jgi:hypothetical protein
VPIGSSTQPSLKRLYIRASAMRDVRVRTAIVVQYQGEQGIGQSTPAFDLAHALSSTFWLRHLDGIQVVSPMIHCRDIDRLLVDAHVVPADFPGRNVSLNFL